MFRKFATIAALTCAALISTNAVYASHRGVFEAHLIGGRVYWYSINFEELIKKITGKDLKDQTFIGAEIKIVSADSLCSNPQSHVITPGKGPKGTAFGTSPNVNDGNLVKSDRTTGNIYQTTATILDLVPSCDTVPEGSVCRLRPPTGANAICKDAPGSSQWNPLFWQDRNCNKGTVTGFQYTCYKDFAAFVNGTLTYVTGEFAGYPVAVGTNSIDYWTFVYLPTTFKFKVDLSIGGSSVEQKYGSCAFPLNPVNGQLYSINNPPPGGWAALLPNGEHVSYSCIAITKAVYDEPN